MVHRSRRRSLPIVAAVAIAVGGSALIAVNALRAAPPASVPATDAPPAPGSAKPDATKARATGFTKPSDEELRKRLTELQYEVTQHEETEPPFRNQYWDNHEPGIYVDVVSGEALFSSLDKFESGTGWPSFTRPLEPGNVVTKEDRSLFGQRTEVRSKSGDSHLGHVFPDGPPPTGLRYCMNSASLRFIPVSKLEAEGYGRYSKLFESGAAATADPHAKK
jgi:methionine-R-sulfoxide reductase